MRRLLQVKGFVDLEGPTLAETFAALGALEGLLLAVDVPEEPQKNTGVNFVQIQVFRELGSFEFIQWGICRSQRSYVYKYLCVEFHKTSKRYDIRNYSFKIENTLF